MSAPLTEVKITHQFPILLFFSFPDFLTEAGFVRGQQAFKEPLGSIFH